MTTTGLNVRNKQTVLVNQSGRVNRKLDNLLDVNTQDKIDGSFLVYDASIDTFVASNVLEEQTLDGGDF